MRGQRAILVLGEVGGEVSRGTYESLLGAAELTMEGYAEEWFVFRSTCLRDYGIPPLLGVSSGIIDVGVIGIEIETRHPKTELGAAYKGLDGAEKVSERARIDDKPRGVVSLPLPLGRILKRRIPIAVGLLTGFGGRRVMP